MDGTPPERWLSRTASKAKRALSVKKSIRRIVKRDEIGDALLNDLPTALDSREYDYLCNTCTQLLTSPAHQRKLFTKGGFSRGNRLYHKEGCRLCIQVVALLEGRGFSEPSRDFSSCTLHALDKKRKLIQEFKDFGFGYGMGVEEKTSGPAELTQLSFLQVQLGGSEPTDVNAQDLIFIAPLFNDPSEKMFVNPNPPLHDYDLEGDFLIRRARAQIRDCRKNHIQCKGASGRLPKRVIDVHPSGDGSTVRIHLTGRHENMTYVALSYCWGGEHKVTTTTETLAANIIGIQKKDLNQTIQDAILVTKKLGHHYLWVDSLCIMQDDKEDREREISQMDEIYSNATLTIAAASTARSDEGFLGPARGSRAESQHKLPLRLPDGQMGYITGMASKTIRNGTGWALDSRAWALQEMMLSRRILIFCDGDVRYQCRKLDFEPIVPSPVTYETKLPRLPRRHQEMQAFLYVKWFDLVENYSRRNLRFEYERLLAISGLVRQIQLVAAHGLEDQSDEYFAGVWRSSLAGNLLWHSPKPVLARNMKVCAPTTPTFSWASLGHGVDFLGVLKTTLEFIQWGVRIDDFQALGGNIALGEKFSCLTINGWILPLASLQQKLNSRRGDPIALEDMKLVLDIWEDYEAREGYKISGASILLRIDDGTIHRGLVLNQLSGKYYRRVGAYSQAEWSSSKLTDVDAPRDALVLRLREAISRPEFAEGFTRAEITLV